MSLKIAINGFGRIGRPTFKIALEHKELEIVAVNDLTDNGTLAHLLKYDSVYGRYNKKVGFSEEYLIVDGKKYRAMAEKDPEKLPWQKLDIDVVLECTGFFTEREGAEKHLKAGAKKVIISAPTKSPDIKTVVMGVNHQEITEKDDIIANASCTTNCIAPVAEILERHFGVQKALLTTIHSYTSTQNLVDGPHKDLRRARAAAVNFVPTTTGAAIAATKTIPGLEGIFDGLAVRVPTPAVSLADLVFLLKKKTSCEEVNKVFEEEAGTERYKGILDITKEAVVSSDFIGHPASSIVDLSLTKVIDGDLVKIMAWYDNEWGYAHQLVQQAIWVGKKI